MYPFYKVLLIGEKEGKAQESIQSSTAPDPGQCTGKLQNTRKHHKQENQKVSPFLTDDLDAAINSHGSKSKTNTNSK